MQTEHPPHPHQFHIKVNGRPVAFAVEDPTARQVLDAAGFTGTFCLAATHGEGGKVIQKFADNEHVDLKKYQHFRATFCGPEVLS